MKKAFSFFLKAFVPKAGIEPARLTAHDFESCASTSSATQAYRQPDRPNRVANMAKL